MRNATSYAITGGMGHPKVKSGDTHLEHPSECGTSRNPLSTCAPFTRKLEGALARGEPS